MIARLVPHAPNFVPIAAMALFGGTVFRFPWSVGVPLLSMVVSDAIIGFSPLPITLSVYTSFAIIVLIGKTLRRAPFWNVPLASLSASTIFFLVTNFAVWIYSGMYEHTLNGLMLSYTYAIPFFRNTAFADMLYSAVIFGIFIYIPKGITLFQIKKKERITALKQI